MINIVRDEQTGEVLLRVLADECPTDCFKTIAPMLEYYYLYVFGKTSLNKKIRKKICIFSFNGK